MSNKTRAFLTRLGEDPDTLDRFQKDPRGVMKEHDVPEDHQALIVSNTPEDRERLKKEADVEDAHLNFIIA